MTDTVSQHERIDLRTTAEIKTLIRRAAATAGMSVSAFLLDAAQERARQVLDNSIRHSDGQPALRGRKIQCSSFYGKCMENVWKGN